MSMHVLWFTARSFSDLCSTTQSALMKGLLEKGYTVCLLNGDASTPFQDDGLEHVPLPTSTRLGFRAQSLAHSMMKWLAQTTLNSKETVAVVEWRVAPRLGPVLNQRGLRWVLMDRSPPADAGLLGRLQWRSWKNAWKVARRSNVPGCVVSPAHQTFVHQRVGPCQTVVLPAGVDLDLFKPAEKEGPLTIVYHGRLDRHRGVLAAVMLAHQAQQQGVEVRLKFIGEGDAESTLQSYAHADATVEVLGKLSRSEVAVELSRCHVGLLPMPPTKVWSLASPLKRGEYLASGLCVFGIDHEGHRLPNTSEIWMRLVPQDKFLTEGVSFLQEVVGRRKEASEQARAYAEANLGWQASQVQFADTLQRAMSDS
jgi:glycosyltransferase involved in cell wall biosynthesis